MSRDLHKVKVTIPEGRAIFAKVEIDGEELRGVTFVKVEAGIPDPMDVQVTLRLFADIEYEGEAEIVKRWRAVAQSTRSTDPGIRCEAMAFDDTQCSRDAGHPGAHVNRARSGRGAIGWAQEPVAVAGGSNA